MVTDLVRFTNVLHAVGDKNGLALIQLHDLLLRRCVSDHGGIAWTHTGDGMIISFEDPKQALLCAVAFHLELQSRDWSELGPPLQARIGLHIGHPRIYEGRLFGTCVNVAVRICSEASASQIVTSESAACVLRSARESHRLRVMGQRLLKGIPEPHTLYEVLWTRTRVLASSLEHALPHAAAADYAAHTLH